MLSTRIRVAKSAIGSGKIGGFVISNCVGDPRFFLRNGPHKLAAVASAAVAEVPHPQAELWLRGVAPLHTAGAHEVSFLDNPQYAGALELTSAGVVIVHPKFRDRLPRSSIPLVTATPYEAWARVAALFHPVPPIKPGIHRSAVIADDVEIDPTCEIGPLCVIESRVVIGPRCRIGPGAVICSGTVIGPDCRIGMHASISHALLGARVYVYPGARIGQEGYGFATTDAGFLTVPQLGRVIIEDDVEIGANTTIDRGSTRDTVIGAGSRLDNLVQIGHNVVLGRCCVIVAQVGISGSTVLEDFVRVGGQAAMAGHLRIGAKAQIGAQAGVISDVESGACVLGSPAQKKHEFFRQIALLKKLARRRVNCLPFWPDSGNSRRA